MLTIVNYKELNGFEFTIKSGWEWMVFDIEECDDKYIVAVLPYEPDYSVWSVGGLLIYYLDRTAATNIGVSNGRYKLTNNKDSRVQYIPSRNLTRRNFELELGIQTALIHQ
jgi:hypothetical protein